MKKKIFGLLGILALAFWLAGCQSEEAAQNTSQNETAADSSAANAAPDEDAEEAVNLVAVGGFEGSGTATRRISNGQFLHTVTAEIGDPAAGKFYEGWLVQGADFFSTGRLEKEGEVYILTYQSDEDQSAYNEVVVTQESESNGLDGVPETHILEGEF